MIRSSSKMAQLISALYCPETSIWHRDADQGPTIQDERLYRNKMKVGSTPGPITRTSRTGFSGPSYSPPWQLTVHGTLHRRHCQPNPAQPPLPVVHRFRNPRVTLLAEQCLGMSDQKHPAKRDGWS